MFNSRHNVDPVFLELLDLVWVVGHQPHAFMSDVIEDVSRNFVISTISREVECEVGIEGVQPTILKVVRLHFCKQANPAPFLSKVQYNSSAFLLNRLERMLELWATVATQASKCISCEAFGVHAH